MCLLICVLAGFFALKCKRIYKAHEKYAHIPGPPRDSFFWGNEWTFHKFRNENR